MTIFASMTLMMGLIVHNWTVSDLDEVENPVSYYDELSKINKKLATMHQDALMCLTLAAGLVALLALRPLGAIGSALAAVAGVYLAYDAVKVWKLKKTA